MAVDWFRLCAQKPLLRRIVAKTETPRPRKERFGAHIEAYRGGMRASRLHIVPGSPQCPHPFIPKKAFLLQTQVTVARAHAMAVQKLPVALTLSAIILSIINVRL
jgi:hypothetical protein